MAEHDHWIQAAITHRGAATEAAKREGLSVHEWAEKHQHDEGVTGHQARLALTLAHLRSHDESKPKVPKFREDKD